MYLILRTLKQLSLTTFFDIYVV